MTVASYSRRGALIMGLGGIAAAGAAALGADGAKMFRRVGVAFGATVSLEVEAPDAHQAEAAFSAGFAEIRRIDRLAGLKRDDGEVFRLNHDGRLGSPSRDLLAMLDMARVMHAATGGAFDVTIQPLWLALDAAAREGRWPEPDEMTALLAKVDQRSLSYDASQVALAAGQQITLNSLARGLAADKVAEALRRVGVTRAFFNTDVLGGAGERPGGGPWRARIRHPRYPEESVGVAALKGCLATSGDYAYAWTPDFARHHIVDARRGASPADYAAVSVLAESGLLADALSTAALLAGPGEAGRLVSRFGAQALFVDKAGGVTMTPGFPVSQA